MNYEHRFRVQAALSRVRNFHSRAESMAAITPPPVFVKMRSTPATLNENDIMDFTMWMGPLPIHWTARIERVTETGFSDRQMRGPFAFWLHRHTFAAVNEQTTEVVDEITVKLSHHPLWWLVGMFMWLGLPFLFTYRGWKTKRMLK